MTSWVDVDSCGVALDVSPQKIRSMAKRYALHITSSDLGNSESVKELFVRNGFVILDINKSVVKGEFNGTTYLEIVARKY